MAPAAVERPRTVRREACALLSQAACGPGATPLERQSPRAQAEDGRVQDPPARLGASHPSRITYSAESAVRGASEVGRVRRPSSAAADPPSVVASVACSAAYN